MKLRLPAWPASASEDVFVRRFGGNLPTREEQEVWLVESGWGLKSGYSGSACRRGSSHINASAVAELLAVR